MPQRQIIEYQLRIFGDVSVDISLFYLCTKLLVKCFCQDLILSGSVWEHLLSTAARSPSGISRLQTPSTQLPISHPSLIIQVQAAIRQQLLRLPVHPWHTLLFDMISMVASRGWMIGNYSYLITLLRRIQRTIDRLRTWLPRTHLRILI